jgi:hypothetical protein
MKLKHWVLVSLILVGGLYVWHTYSMHGGTSGFKAGLGIGGH